MSRYTIPSKDPLNFHCVVGYDDPLQTFFANVETLVVDEEREDDLIFANGYTSQEVKSVDELQNAISQYADIPPYIREKLEEDKKNSKGPNVFQKRMISLVEGIMNYER
jgi:hypothetical protein